MCILLCVYFAVAALFQNLDHNHKTNHSQRLHHFAAEDGNRYGVKDGLEGKKQRSFDFIYELATFGIADVGKTILENSKD